VRTDLSSKRLAIKTARSTDHDVSADVEAVMELLDLLGSNSVDNVPVTECGLTEVVVLNGD
jgi:hypothetical protein